MKILGIESTAHTAAIAIVEDGEIIKDFRKTYTAETGGIVPRESSEFMAKQFPELIDLIKDELNNIDVVAYSAAPGIGTCLRNGAALARYLSIKLNTKLMPINHAIAHLEISKKFFDPEKPIYVYVSGGNTQIIAFDEIKNRYYVMGETLDIALGNALDKLARAMDLGHPGGPKLEALARDGKKFIDMPYVVKGMDLSYSGILTFAKKLIGKEKIEDIAFSYQEHLFAMLVEVAERALSATNSDSIVLVGGVAQNKRLREMFEIMCKERGAKLYSIPIKYAGDNAAMIAYTAYLRLKNNRNVFIEPEKAWYYQKARVNQDVEELVKLMEKNFRE